MVYFTANTYKNWERIGKPFDKNGKLYQIVKCECDRCTHGIYAIGVENGQIKPHPAYNGICLKCGGTGFLTKEVRLYTEKELETMNKNAEVAKVRKDEARRKEMEENFAKKKIEWLKSHGFNEDEVTYIVKGETYSIKDELKAEGFIFDPVLLWHRSTPSAERETISIKAEDILEFSAWGEGHYLTEAKEKIKNLINPPSASNSTWLDKEPGDSFKELPVTLVRKSSFDGRYGTTYIFTFITDKEQELVWFTSTNPNIELNETFFLSGKVKEKNIYKNKLQTIVTRCKIS